jgi:hypothetical protein
MQSQDINSSELGAIKYVSELLDWNIKKTANLFILILIFVFDPLAITLVIATNQAFKGKRKEDTPQVTNQVTDEVPTNYRPSTDEVEPIIIEKIVEVPVYLEKDETPIDEYFDLENTDFDLQEENKVKRLRYTKKND